MTTDLITMREEGRLIRHEWHRRDADGRDLLCLYTALANDPEARPETCPADLMPQWLAYLMPWIDDAGTTEAWPSVILRVARVAPNLPRLSPACEWRVRALCVQEAMRHTKNADVLAVCNHVVDLCGRKATGEECDEELAAAWAAKATETAAKAVARAAAKAVARAAAKAVARAAAKATETAAEAADRLTDKILGVLEADLGMAVEASAKTES